MQFDYAPRFKKQFRNLPLDIRERAGKQLALLLENPQHPSLRLHKMEGYANMWEISVTINYRIVFQIEGDKYILFKIGSHDILKK
ncbi:MAG: type II toxin-antitoxin system RelE/ParE family toxin [Candidatus Omnitrophota bacterium]